MFESQTTTSENQSDKLQWLRLWLPVIAWGALISFFSTSLFSERNTAGIIEPILRWLMPSAPMSTLLLFHDVVRKAAHFTEYGVLFWLLMRGPLSDRPLSALALCGLYALVDEGHQIFVPMRTPSIFDVGLDFSGALFSNFLRRGMLALGSS